MTPKADKTFLLTDSNVHKLIVQYLPAGSPLRDAHYIVIPAGECHKNLTTLSAVWQALSEGGATRRSVLYCVGGGVVTDLGGFAAASFKRGIRYVNIATTLLGAVDAAVGGKTGIDFGGLKNEIGAFHLPERTEIWSELFTYLPRTELLSGYAEMVKCAMLADRATYRELTDIDTALDMLSDPPLLGHIASQCAAFKQSVVDEDLYDTGRRRTLNLGHTAGHAFESLLLSRHTPVPHGVAVAHGLLVSLILSRMTSQEGTISETSTHKAPLTDSTEMYAYRDFLRAVYPALPIRCTDIPQLIDLTTHDKKNHTHLPRFILLRTIGDPHSYYEADIDTATLQAALETYLDLLQS